MTQLETAIKELAGKMQSPRPEYATNPNQRRTLAPAASYPPTVAPYMPGEARVAAQAHERTGHPAFVKAYEKSTSPLACPNCQDVGAVMLTLAKAGPFKSPPGGVITWFDGNEQYGQGWYVIDRTMQFDCPECAK